MGVVTMNSTRKVGKRVDRPGRLPLPDGTTADQILAAIEEGDMLPVVPLGGVQAIMPGRTQHLQLDLEPGTYVIWCENPESRRSLSCREGDDPGGHRALMLAGGNPQVF
jgi:hypothetical protein